MVGRTASRIWPAALACAALACAGCTHKRTIECSALIQVINTGVQDIENGPKRDQQLTAADYKNIATAMDKVAVDAQKVEISVPDLKKLSADYQAMARDMAKSAREMAEADEKKDQAKLATAQEALQKAANREEPLVDGINKICQAP
jgi:hypothetical protein